jgi:NAD(P)H-dependent flavin oxidoreductase YrpB (nitropropane dioxygenase family)
MLKTSLCELLGLDVPIILAPMGTCTSAELAAAVSNEGGLGGIGSLFGPPRPAPQSPRQNLAPASGNGWNGVTGAIS